MDGVKTAKIVTVVSMFHLIFGELYVMDHCCAYDLCLLYIAYKPPITHLKCTADYMEMSKVVNATWEPESGIKPEDVFDDISNCGSSINCSSGYRRDKVHIQKFFWFIHLSTVDVMSIPHTYWFEWWMGMERFTHA